MTLSPSKRLMIAAAGLCIALYVPQSARADSCGQVGATNLCPDNCDQSNCEDWCDDITPGPCEAKGNGHNCVDTTCWCQCQPKS